MTAPKHPTDRALRAAKLLEARGWDIYGEENCNVCKPCGKSFALDARFCPKCGQPLTMSGGPIVELEEAIAAANGEAT